MLLHEAMVASKYNLIPKFQCTEDHKCRSTMGYSATGKQSHIYRPDFIPD